VSDIEPSTTPAGNGMPTTPEELAAYVEAAVARHSLTQAMAAASVNVRTPEELLGERDLPVTHEVAALLKTVPLDKQAWLLSVAPVKAAILRGRPIAELAVIFDHLTGYRTDVANNQVGPATASLLQSAA
jgi:hypothetical protein